MSADAVLEVNGQKLPITRFTPEEIEKTMTLDATVKARGADMRVTQAADIFDEITDLVYASVHRADSTISQDDMATMIGDQDSLRNVYHDILGVSVRPFQDSQNPRTDA